MDATGRTLRARLAASERWAREPDRTKATAAARAGLQARFEREVDPDGVLTPEERAKRADSARRAHYTRMALARRRKQKAA
jgi:hypothetical protein